MRISDWSSDVCSSDLRLHHAIDKQSQPAFSRHPPRRCMRRGKQTQFLQVLHHIPDRCGRQIEAGQFADGARSDRNPGAKIALHDNTENIARAAVRSEEHTSELQSLMRISYAVFCLKKKTKT